MQRNLTKATLRSCQAVRTYYFRDVPARHLRERMQAIAPFVFFATATRGRQRQRWIALEGVSFITKGNCALPIYHSSIHPARLWF